MTEKEQQLVYELNSTEADRILWKTTAIKQGNAIAELKAQVNCLREALLMIAMPTGGDQTNANHSIAIKALEATPEQCLAEVKAKAIEEIVAEFNKTGLLGTSLTNLISDYVTQLREQSK